MIRQKHSYSRKYSGNELLINNTYSNKTKKYKQDDNFKYINKFKNLNKIGRAHV